MKEIMSRLTSYLLYGGITRKEYESIREDIQERNRSSLEIAVLFLALLFGGLYLGSLFSAEMELNRLLYGVTGICSLFILFCCICFKKKDNRFVLPLWYLTMTLMFTYAIYLNIFLSPDTSATTFFLILIAAPLLLMEKTWRLLIYFALVLGTFVPMVFHEKRYSLAFSDTVNAICSGLLGILIHMHIFYVNLQEILLRRHLEKERDTDPLTGCLTKEAFVSRVKGYLSNRDQSGVLIILDIDHFKIINDTYGHLLGDLVIHAIGERICQNFRGTDVVGRFGGDEFLVWLPGDWDRDSLECRLQMLLEKLHNVEIPNERIKIEASIGVAMCPENGDTYETLFQNADMALYSAKNLGRNRYVFCSN